MSRQTLEDVMQSVDDTVEMLRRNGHDYTDDFPVVPNEYTNWIDEQRAIVETCALGDLSHHMDAIHFEGPDVVDLLSDLCVNDFDDFEVGRAKQIVACNPHGDIMGDGPLLRLGEEEFWGVPTCSDWILYNAEAGDYDVETELDPLTPMQEGIPDTFIFQVQGPNTHDVLDQLTDADLRDLGFYRFEEIELAGREVRAFGHGMNTETGYEFHGPYEYADEIREAIVEAGREHGLKQLGSKAYLTQSVRLGWIVPGPPPIYEYDDMQGFREYLSARSWEATYSIEGSYEADDIADYYMDPVELGYERLIDFDHDFVGKEALREKVENQRRELVSLQWDADDVVDVYASRFRPGDSYKYMELPRIAWARAPCDEVRKDGETVGISHTRAYQCDVDTVVSLCRLDLEHAKPGTEVTVVWGEGETSNPKVEQHVQTELTATVAPAPYSEDRRKRKQTA